MDPVFLSNLINGLVGAGLPSLLMAVAVCHLNKSNNVLIQELNREREERLDAMQAHIEKLEAKSDTCERDRLELHRQIAKLVIAEAARTD